MLRLLLVFMSLFILSACDLLPNEWFEKEITTNVIGDGVVYPEKAVVRRGDSFDFLLISNYNTKLSMVSGCEGVINENTYTIQNVKDDCVVNAVFEYSEPQKSLSFTSNRMGRQARLTVHNRWSNVEIEQIVVEGLIYRTAGDTRYRVDDFVIYFRNIPGGESSSSRLLDLRSRDADIVITRISSCSFSIFSSSDCTDLAVAAEIDEKISRTMLPITISKRK